MNQYKIIFPILLTVLSINLNFAQNQGLNDEKFINKVDQEFYENYKKCMDIVESETYEWRRKGELREICTPQEGYRIIKISYSIENVEYQELYFEITGKLRYSKETEITKFENGESMEWNNKTYLENGRIKTYISHGHGKTESEEWDLGSILDQYKTRVDQVAKR